MGRIMITTEYDHDLAQQYHLERLTRCGSSLWKDCRTVMKMHRQFHRSCCLRLVHTCRQLLTKAPFFHPGNDFTDFYQAENATSASKIIYQAFYEIKQSYQNSDRLIVVYQLDAHGMITIVMIKKISNRCPVRSIIWSCSHPSMILVS